MGKADVDGKKRNVLAAEEEMEVVGKKEKKQKKIEDEAAVEEESAPKPKKAKKAKAEAVEEEAQEAEEPAPKKKKKTKKAAVEEEEVAAEEEAPEAEEPAPKKKKKTKKAAVVEEEEAAAEEEEPVKSKKVKKAKKAVVEEEEAEGDAEAEEPAPKKEKKARKVSVDEAEAAPAKEEAAEENLTVFVGGIPFSCTKETLEKDFAECGEIEKLHMPLNDEGNPRGIAFITYKTKEGVAAAVKFDGEDYGGRTLKVNVAGKGGKGDKGKGKGEKGKGKGGNEFTAFVRGLPWSTTEDSLRKDFEECGEIESLRMPLNDEGKPKGIAFIAYKTKEGLDKAKEFNETDYGGRTIYVDQAGQGGGKGKDGKGKDGKGKGKDGKGKGKDGKGKGKKGKGKAPSEAFAKSQGVMVEGTGTKQTFEDSDDE